MQLSILIPTYNYDCTRLVNDLHTQCQALASTAGLTYEIIVADDGSTDSSCLDANQGIGLLPHCRFVKRGHNVGRSRIRNILTDMSQGDMLLFLDQDGKVETDDFVSRFISMGRDNEVVCGRMVQPDMPSSSRYHLRYRYELRYQQRMTAERLNSDPNSPFRSFCFLIHSHVARKVRMDETFDCYGYEDVRYGIDLTEAGYSVVHADIPLTNDDIEDNASYVAKTEEALRTLHTQRHILKGHSQLLRTVDRLRTCGMMAPLRCIGKPLMPLMRRNLSGLHPRICLFNIYKLLYYASLK